MNDSIKVDENETIEDLKSFVLKKLFGQNSDHKDSAKDYKVLWKND